MLRRTLLIATLATTFTAFANQQADAAQPEFTAIYVTDMHCADCAKKIAARLYTVPGVVEVRANLKEDMAFVTPQNGKTLSPKKIWEAVENAGFQPTKLHGPSGNFTKKPTS